MQLQLTDAGKQLLAQSPPLLQDTFISRFTALQAWEQHMLLSNIQRIAMLMDTQTRVAEPLLTDDPSESDVSTRHHHAGTQRTDTTG